MNMDVIRVGQRKRSSLKVKEQMLEFDFPLLIIVKEGQFQKLLIPNPAQGQPNQNKSNLLISVSFPWPQLLHLFCDPVSSLHLMVKGI